MAPPAKLDDTVADGFVTPSFAQGSLFVKNAAGETIRLAWEPVEGVDPPAPGKTARWRGLPPGDYTVIGYRIVRKDDTGTEWCLSGIAPKGLHRLTVKPGRMQRVPIDPSITFGAKGSAKNGFMVQVPIQGHHHAGVTIYKNGKRIPMRYTVAGSDGQELESAKLNYG